MSGVVMHRQAALLDTPLCGLYNKINLSTVVWTGFPLTSSYTHICFFYIQVGQEVCSGINLEV